MTTQAYHKNVYFEPFSQGTTVYNLIVKLESGHYAPIVTSKLDIQHHLTNQISPTKDSKTRDRINQSPLEWPIAPKQDVGHA